MTTLASPLPATVISETVRKRLLISLIADLSDATTEGFTGAEVRDLLRRLEPPFLHPRLTGSLQALDASVLKVLLYMVRRTCRRHFGCPPDES